MIGLARLRDLIARRPLLIAAVGSGLLAEGARVLWGWHGGGEVVVLGHGGLSRWSAATDGPELLVYAGWVAVAGGSLVISAAASRIGARRSARASVASGEAAIAPAVGARPQVDPSVVVRTRPVVERRRG